MLPDIVPKWLIAYHPVHLQGKRTLDGKKYMNVLPSINDKTSIFFLTLIVGEHKLFIRHNYAKYIKTIGINRKTGNIKSLHTIQKLRLALRQKPYSKHIYFC